MKAVVEIKGGFGNQIFQYSFANYLKNKGYKVTVNLSTSNNRFPLDCRNFGFKKASKIFVWFLRFLFSISQKRFYFVNFNWPINTFFRKEYNFESFSKNKKRFLNYFDGYWQNIDLVKSQKVYLKKCLEIHLDNSINTPNNIIGSTLVHVRRGDYINVNEELNIEFYVNALNFCKKNIKNFNYEVFTDDLQWVKNQKIFNDAKSINGPKNNLDNLLVDINKMLEFQNYVVGNSTFSLIPALLSNSEHPLIIVANPWMRNSISELKLDNSWIKIKNF